MALQLTFDDRHGSTHASAYHRIKAIQIDFRQQIGVVVLETFVDAGAAASEKSPVNTQDLVFDVGSTPDFDAIFGDDAHAVHNPRNVAYTQIKTMPEWSSSSDV
jgi:hypothetical protein